MRIGGEAALRRGQAHAIEQLYRPRPRVAPTEAAALAQRLHDLVADGEDGIQAGGRVLKDHRDLDPAQRGQAPLGGAGDAPPRQLISPAQHLARVADEAEQRAQSDALPAARLAHEADGAAGGHVEVDPVGGQQQPARRRESDCQPSHRQQLGLHLTLPL